MLPIVYGGEAVEKASRSSILLASDPALTGVSGAYFDTNGRPSRWPACALDERNRDAVWSLCERVSGRSAPRARQ